MAQPLRRIALAAALLLSGQALPGEDCNRNGADDALDLAARTSGDCDQNGIPDECDTAPAIALALPRSTLLDRAPTALAAADLDGDADVDLAAAVDGGLAILRGDGKGTFSAAGEVALGPAPTHVIASDLDGDGDLDLAVPSTFRSLDGHGLVTVISNAGAGSFRAAMDLPVGLRPTGLAAADLDGDGNMDLAAASSTDDSVSLLHGKGDGSFETARRLEIGGAPISVAAADLDRDGKLDLVVGDLVAATLAVLIQGPGPAFARSDVALASAVEDFVTLDLGGDGLPDLAVTQVDGGLPHVLLLENRGGGAFDKRTIRGPGSSFDGTTPAACSRPRTRCRSSAGSAGSRPSTWTETGTSTSPPHPSRRSPSPSSRTRAGANSRNPYRSSSPPPPCGSSPPTWMGTALGISSRGTKAT